MSNDKQSFAILEDYDSDYELMVRYLRSQGFDFHAIHVSDKGEFDRFIERPAPDLILADFSLPGFTAMDVLLAIRERWRDLPVIIVSGTLQEEALVDLFRGGATDFILKDKLFRLGPAVSRALEDYRRQKDLEMAEMRVVDLLREKNTLLMELHDRVKNNLQVVLGIMRMELDKTAGEENRNRIQRMIDRIWSMALIHQEIYRVEHYSRIDFSGYLSRLTDDLCGSYYCRGRHLVIDNQIRDIELSIGKVMPCAMIVQEILSFMLGFQYSHRESGTVSLEFQVQNGFCYFSITDDGAGLGDPYRQEDISEISRLIIDQAVRQLEGSYRFDLSGGFVFAVSFPS